MLTLTVGGVSGFFTASSVRGWYTTLRKPWFNPPDWIFGPVWTLLYVMMGVALYMVWNAQADASLKSRALLFFFWQLTLNFFWSFLFFYAQRPGWALADILLLAGLIILTILAFGRVSSTAAWLLVPYICWVCFAAVLNAHLWWMNRH